MRKAQIAALGLVNLVVAAVPAIGYADLLGVEPDTARGDGVYGRFDGDLDVGVGLGARLSAPGFGPNLRASAHFLSSVGLVVDLTRPLLGDTGWSLGTAIDLRPLFLPRWAFDLEQGPALVDLLVDSVSVSGGPVFHPLNDAAVGFGLEAGFGIPLSQTSQGFWLDLRASGRWVGDATPWGGLVSLSWHTSLLTPLVD